MACPLFVITRATFLNLVNVLIFLILILIVGSIALLIFAIYVKKTLGDYINMVSSNDGYILPIMLSISAVICLPINCFGLKLIVPVRNNEINSRQKCWLFVYIISTILVAVWLVSASVIGVSLLHVMNVEDSIGDGILKSMRIYSSDADLKSKVDRLQINFKCCGSKSYTEWFNITWFDQNLGGVVPIDTGYFVSDDVPFSCCAEPVMRPCIHHGILTSSAVYRYDPMRQLSVSSSGCHDKIIKTNKSLFTEVICLHLILASIQGIVCIGSRILHTAIKSFPKNGISLKQNYEVWLFGSLVKTESEVVQLIPNDDTDNEGIDSEGNTH